MIIFGIDPGPKTCGFAVLNCDRFEATFVAKGTFPSNVDGVADAIERHGPVLLVALEQPAGYAYSIERSKDLIETARVGGLINGIATLRGIEVKAFPATEWRRSVVGKGNASNKLISLVVPRQIKGWPKRSNNHERDAAGVALYVGRRLFWQRQEGRQWNWKR